MASRSGRASRKGPHDDVLRELRAFGLTYPGAHFKSPWPGHMDLAVNDRTFAYLSLEGEPLGVSCKLPATSSMALMLPFAEPTGYGLGRAGWVSARFAARDRPPVAMLRAWIDESYRAQAPRKLLKRIGAPGPALKTQAPGKPRGAASRIPPGAPARRTGSRS